LPRPETAAEGTVTFSLPETNGRTRHFYVRQSPCAEHDRANTNEAIDENAAAVGGRFSVSFPIDPSLENYQSLDHGTGRGWQQDSVRLGAKTLLNEDPCRGK
jgi:hypothetical protein